MDFSRIDKRLLFTSLLKQGFIFRLKGDEPFESSDYHVFVVLNYSPNTGKLLYLVNGTSQVRKDFVIYGPMMLIPMPLPLLFSLENTHFFLKIHLLIAILYPN